MASDDTRLALAAFVEKVAGTYWSYSLARSNGGLVLLEGPGGEPTVPLWSSRSKALAARKQSRHCRRTTVAELCVRNLVEALLADLEEDGGFVAADVSARRLEGAVVPASALRDLLRPYLDRPIQEQAATTEKEGRGCEDCRANAGGCGTTAGTR